MFFPSKIRNSKALDENIEINAAIIVFPNSSSLKYLIHCIKFSICKSQNIRALSFETRGI